MAESVYQIYLYGCYICNTILPYINTDIEKISTF